MSNIYMLVVVKTTKGITSQLIEFDNMEAANFAKDSIKATMISEYTGVTITIFPKGEKECTGH